MTALVQEYSTITAKGQTTVPKSVRQALGVESGDRIAFHVDEHGVSIRRVDVEDADPALDSFLKFLAKDVTQHPEGLKAFAPVLAERISRLTDGMVVDLDEAIDGKVDL
jgi:antitoxin PrlF